MEGVGGPCCFGMTSAVEVEGQHDANPLHRFLTGTQSGSRCRATPAFPRRLVMVKFRPELKAWCESVDGGRRGELEQVAGEKRPGVAIKERITHRHRYAQFLD